MKFREKIAQSLDLPSEVTMGISRIEILGDGSVQIENYRGILEYDSQSIRVKTDENTIQIQGTELEICEITDENIQIKGAIKKVCL